MTASHLHLNFYLGKASWNYKLLHNTNFSFSTPSFQGFVSLFWLPITDRKFRAMYLLFPSKPDSVFKIVFFFLLDEYDRIIVFPKCSCPNAGTHKYATLHGKRHFANVITLCSWVKGNSLEWSGWAQGDHKDSCKKEVEDQMREPKKDLWMMEAEVRVRPLVERAMKQRKRKLASK